MKKIILLFGAVLTFTVTNAQTAMSQADIDSRATSLTTEMNKVVTLTSAQQTKVQIINADYVKLIALNMEKAKDDPNQQIVERKRVENKWEQELNGVLTPEQMTKWKNRNAPK